MYATGLAKHTNGHFARIKLNTSQEVLLNIKRLTAFTEGIRFQTIFSPRLSSFLRFQLWHTIAYGEGEMIATGNGREIDTIGRGDVGYAVEPHQIIAMDCRTEYTGWAELGKRDSYLEPFTISAPKGVMFVTDASDDGGAKNIITKHLKRLISFLIW